MKMKVLSRNDILSAIDMKKMMETVENVYRAKAEGKTEVWPTVFYDFKTGEQDMDIKSGYLKSEGIHGLKVINWTAANETKGLPSLVGIITVFETKTGMPLGVLDGSVITGLRTGCAGAIGAGYLAGKKRDTLFVLGAGNQALYQIGAFILRFPELRKIYVADPVVPEKAAAFVGTVKERLMSELKIDADRVEFKNVSSEEDMAAGVGDTRMIVTVTPARNPVIKKDWIRPGTHLSCIGSDMSGKEEIEAEIFKGARVYADDLQHCMEVGEMEIPLKTGVISEADICGEIGELILGKKQGRRDDDEITIYDATGMALLDIAAAKAVLDMAEKTGAGQTVEI